MKKNSTSDSANLNEFKFLSNKAIGEDLFKNKSQEKIANVISEKIINEVGFKVIGIDGTWGSGKSNLVHLIEKKLDKTHKFFIYDVWGHQEDEQRKAILVEFTEFIKSKDKNLVSNKKNWDEKLEKLLANSKITKTTNQPYLSVGFIFSLLSIVYIPTVNVFKDNLADFLNVESWFWRLVLVSFPIFIVIVIFIYNLIESWVKNNGFFQSFRLSAEETFQVYTNKQKKESKIETISENQPTVRDFQNWMEEIDNDLNKSVIIVFDNFDRLPKKHILNIWSSIHIFFAEKEYENIKVILPFDRDHVQNAFKELNSNTDDKTFADDYVNKTFDIVFRISLPIMSDWKQFFREQWRKAYNQVDEIELEKVIQVYEFLNRRITPREIIVFINEILTIKHLDDDLKERYISIFILCKDHILSDSLKAIIDLDYLNGLETLYSNDEEYPKQITSIVFHIPVEEATELIYTEQLKQALNRKDSKQFNDICNTVFINDIFFGAINGLEELSNPILTLDKIVSDSRLSQHKVEEAWKNFYSKTLSKEIKIADLKVEEWQLALLKNVTDSRFLNKLLNKYNSMVPNFEIDEYLNVLDILFENLGKENVLTELNSVMISPEKLLKIIELKGREFSNYKCDCTDEELDDYLASLTIVNILEIKHTSILVSSFALPKYQQLLLTKTQEFAIQNDIKNFDNVITKIKETVSQNEDLKDCIPDDQIYGLYVNNVQQKPQLSAIKELIAMRIARGSNFNQSYKAHFEEILKSENEDIADEISNTILNYIRYDELLLLAETYKDSILYRNVVLKLIHDGDIKKDLDTQQLFNNYKTIKTSLDIDDNILLIELDNWGVDFEEIETLDDEFVTDCFDNIDLDISKEFLKEFNKFSAFDEEAYKNVFGDETNFYFRHFDKLDNISLNQASLNAFKTIFINSLKESASISDLLKKVFIKYEKNNIHLSIQNLLKDLRDTVLTSGIDFNVEKALFFIPYFLKYELLEGNDDVFRKFFKIEFFSNNAYLNLLLENPDQIKQLYKSANSSDKSDFRNTINERRGGGNEYDKIARLLDIKKK